MNKALFAPEKISRLSSRNSLVIGLTLFTMFFGAGNLILAPYLGYEAGQATPLAMVGFLVSAVGLPVIAIASVGKVGSMRKLADRISPRFSEFFALCIYLCIGPFLAIPRISSTAFEMLTPFLPEAQLGIIQAIFSIAFYCVALFLAMNPNRLSKVMGKVSGPCLLALIVLIVGSLIIAPPYICAQEAQGAYITKPVLAGFICGYQTMDVLASLAFGVVISLNIRQMGLTDERSIAAQTIRSGIIAGGLLLLIYCGFAYLGYAMQASMDNPSNGAQVISAAAAYEFGIAGTIIVAATFFIACLNVCTGLICAISTYFYQNYPRLSYKKWAVLFTVVSCVLSNVGLTMILQYSIPILCALYPVGICLVVMGLMQKDETSHKRSWQASAYTCLVVSCIFAIRDGFIPGFWLILDLLPLSEFSMAWILPTVIAWFIPYLISHLRHQTS